MVLRRLLRFLRHGLSSRPDVPPASVGPKELYVFFDEAGDLNFRENGSRVFLIGVLCVQDPWPVANELHSLRQELFRGRMIPACFHASEDRQAVRDRVFQVIAGADGLTFHVTVTQKQDVPAEYREEESFYQFVADFALRGALERHPSAEPVYVVTDQLPVKRKQKSVTKGLKASLAATLGARRYELEHHASAAHAGLQVADYLNWALYRKWQSADDRSYDLIRHLIASETQVPWSRLK